MLAKFRSRLTYANVMVTALMFIVLGGVAYAANTISSADVINESLRSVDLKDGAAVTSDDVSVGERDPAALLRETARGSFPASSEVLRSASRS